MRNVCVGMVIAGVVGAASGQVVEESRRLLGDGVANGDLFGSSLAIGDGIIAVGSMRDDDRGLNSGSVYLFDAETGVELMKIVPEGSGAVDQVGNAMVISDGVLAIAAHNTDDLTGTVYLYDLHTGVLLREARPRRPRRFSNFGESMAIDGGVLAVGGPGDSSNGLEAGEAYLIDLKTGAQTHSLKPKDGRAYDLFGSSIDIEDGLVAVGAYQDDDGGYNTGSGYLFDAVSGEEIMEIYAEDGEEDDYFGREVLIEEGRLYVSAVRDGVNGPSSGSVYVYDVQSGTELMRIIPDDGEDREAFGSSIAIQNGVLVVACPRSDEQALNSGVIYLYDAISGEELGRLAASNGEAQDWLGFSIAIDAGRIAAASIYHNDHGMAYVLDACAGDFNLDWRYTYEDASAFLGAYAAGADDADLNGDGALTFFDVAAFVEGYLGGCL